MWDEAVIPLFSSQFVVYFAITTFCCSLCFLLFLWSSLLLFDTLSPISTVSFFFFISAWFFPFLCSFSTRNGSVPLWPNLSHTGTERWAAELAESTALVWLCRDRMGVLLLWGFLRNNIGAVPTVYSKRTAVLKKVQQGEGHFFQVRYNNPEWLVRCVSGLRNKITSLDRMLHGTSWTWSIQPSYEVWHRRGEADLWSITSMQSEEQKAPWLDDIIVGPGHQLLDIPSSILQPRCSSVLTKQPGSEEHFACLWVNLRGVVGEECTGVIASFPWAEDEHFRCLPRWWNLGVPAMHCPNTGNSSSLLNYCAYWVQHLWWMNMAHCLACCHVMPHREEAEAMGQKPLAT